ncbi:hypothetical protein MNBD_IGNAVI01-1336 [hydrothermal vent metagenome]|uniref:Inner membrane protein YgaP-like transmembrane domain-containing protein n=1 Tax=hydrothermal vent metagenome TaxID=652676 RepID=A0A3B1D5X1_9ZZZZ
MKKNVGSVDRLLRLILAAVIIVWGVYAESWWGLIGLIPLMTGLMNWCPIYAPFKISTIKAGDNKKEI